MRTPRNDQLSDRLTPDARHDPASSSPASSRDAAGHAPIRKCILSGVHGAPDQLVRLALGPDNAIAPDVRAKAPGRGAWIAVDYATLVAAQQKGKLKGALARAFKDDKPHAPVSLADDIAAALERETLNRLGLEARAGTLLTGAEKIDAAARAGKVHLLLHARDAGADGRGKRDQSWRVGRDAEGSDLKGRILPIDRGPLSVALGRENAVHVALIDAGAAKRVRAVLDRWQTYIGWNDTTGGPSHDALPAHDGRQNDE